MLSTIKCAGAAQSPDKGAEFTVLLGSVRLGFRTSCVPACNALHCRHALRTEEFVTAPAERMKMMRQSRRARGLRELRLVVADPRSRTVRRGVAKQVAGLDLDRERPL